MIYYSQLSDFLCLPPLDGFNFKKNGLKIKMSSSCVAKGFLAYAKLH